MILIFLKKNNEKNPPFQSSKVEAIEKIGFGKVGKIFLEFERPFW